GRHLAAVRSDQPSAAELVLCVPAPRPPRTVGRNHDLDRDRRSSGAPAGARARSTRRVARPPVPPAAARAAAPGCGVVVGRGAARRRGTIPPLSVPPHLGRRLAHLRAAPVPPRPTA